MVIKMEEDIVVHWFDDGLAEIECLCGKNDELSIDNEAVDKSRNTCSYCGRKYRLIQYVELVQDE